MNIKDLQPNSFKIVKPVTGASAPLNIKNLAAGSFKPVSTITDYANQSANPAVTPDNQTPSWWSKVVAGTPLAPATEGDTKYTPETSWTKPLVTTAKMLANVFSDAPGILSAIPTAIIHPIKTVEGLVNAVSGISNEAVDAISTGLATGDWSQLGQDVQKTEVSVINHPLQTVLLLDGALESSKNVLQGFQDKGLTGGLSEMATDTQKKVRGYIDNIDTARKNISKAFTSKSTINNHLSNIQNTLNDKITAFKTVDDLKGKLTSFTDKPKGEVNAGEEKVQTNLGEQEKIKNQLALEQTKLDELNKQHTEQTNNMASDQNKEMKLKSGFNSISDIGDSLKKLGQTVKSKLSAVYNSNLGNSPVDLSGVFKGFDGLKSYLSSVSDSKTIKALNPLIDNLKIRDLVTKYGDNTTELYKQLSKQNVDPKLWQNLTEDQLKKNFPAVTSENVKGTISNIEQVIRTNNLDALKSFGDTVRSSFTDALKGSIKDNYGQDQLDKINENDKAYTDLKNSKLLNTSNPTLSSIVSGWSDFVKSASKIPEGQDLITKLQNYVGSQILDNAERNGEYNASKITDGIKKYGSVLDDTTRSRLQSVADSINDKTNIDTQQNKVEQVKTQQKEVAKEGQQLAKQQVKVIADAKDIGNDSADVEKKIMGIDSMEKLDSFLKSTGKTIKEVTPVIVQALVEQADKEAGKGSGSNYDLKVVDSFIQKMDKLGGSTSEGQTVNDALLGGADSETVKKFNEMKKLNEQYKKLTDVKSRSTAGRILKGAFGAFLAVGGLGFGRFKGISDIRSALSSGETADIPGGRERVSPIEPTEIKPKIKKTLRTGAILKTGQDNSN